MAHSIPAEYNLLTPDEIQRHAHQQMTEFLQNSEGGFNLVAHQFKSSKEWLEAWKKEYQEIIQHLCEVESAEEQRIKIRKESLVLIENCAITLPFLREGLTDEEVEILLKHRHPEVSLMEAKEAQYQVYLFSEASLLCLRHLSTLFSDSGKEDWFDLCFEIHQQHISHLYRLTLAQLTGVEYNFESLAEIMQKMIDEVEEKVLDGKPWNFANKLRDVRQFQALQTEASPLTTGPTPNLLANIDKKKAH